MIQLFCLLFALLLFGGYALHAANKHAVISRDLLVEAIRLVENTPRGFVGRQGERSEWQFKPATWSQYSDKPFTWASESRALCVAEQQRVAYAHVAWILARLPSLGRPTNSYQVGIVWCAGYGAAEEDRITHAQYDYADRVHNIYHELLKKSVKRR